MHSAKLRRWEGEGKAGYSYWCQGCQSAHSVVTEGPGAWSFNGDLLKPVFTPSVLTTREFFSPAGLERRRAFAEQHGRAPTREEVPYDAKDVCHTFVGCNGAQPGQVIFLGDCTHALAGQVLPLPDRPRNYGWSGGEPEPGDAEGG